MSEGKLDLGPPCEDHMIVIDLNQKSEQWLSWRAQGITASDIPIILGLSPYKTPWMLWAEKVGIINPPDLSKNPNVKRGIALEDNARQVAEERYGEVLLPMCGEYGGWRVLRASLDGICSKDIPHEFKCPSKSVWEDIDYDSEWSDVDKHGTESSTYKLYEAQVQAQCVVAGSPVGRLFFYKENGEDREYEVALTPERKEQILQAAKEFWNLVQTRQPPKVDPERDWFIPESEDDRFKWAVYAEAWRVQAYQAKSLKDQLRALETEQKATQRELIALMGPYMHADIGGVKVSRFTKKGSIDYQKFLEDRFPDQDFDSQLESYRKTSREEARFTLSEDDLVVEDVREVVTTVNSAYF